MSCVSCVSGPYREMRYTVKLRQEVQQGESTNQDQETAGESQGEGRRHVISDRDSTHTSDERPLLL